MIRPPSAHDRMKRAEHRIRTLGYDDGYAGRPARYSLRALYGYRPADEYRASIFPPHGTESRYSRGCRCMFCREAARVARAGRRARAKT